MRQKRTHRPWFQGVPNARDLKFDLAIMQIPQDLKLQSTASLVPKSQMHWDAWKLRTSRKVGLRDLPTAERPSISLGGWQGAHLLVQLVSIASVSRQLDLVYLLKGWCRPSGLPFTQELCSHCEGGSVAHASLSWSRLTILEGNTIRIQLPQTRPTPRSPLARNT